MYRGDTYVWDFRLWQDRERTVPVDLTDTTAKAEIRDRPGGVLLVELPVSITPPNLITMRLARDDALKLTRRNAMWDLQLTLADGTVVTVIAGHVHITLDITDSAA